MRGEFVKAEGCLANAVSTERGNAAVADLIGTAFRLAGNLAHSLEWHERAVERAPEHVPFRLNLANAYLFVGDTTAATAHLEAALAADPDDPLAHWLLSRARSAESEEHVKRMQALLDETGDVRSRAYLLYAIGKEKEDLERWDEAFDAYHEGAATRRQSVAYDETAEQALFETIVNRFTEHWQRQNRSECVSNSPVFIIGQPRTGTTLLDRMLDAHPAAVSGGELRHFGFAVRRVTGIDEPHQFSATLMQAASTADVTAIGEAYVASTNALRGDAAHVIDKLPSNFYYLPLILAALPNARVLHVVREPMDTCFAAYKQLFASAYLYSYDQQETARHYVRYRRFMDTMRKRFGDRFLDVSYETLVSDTEPTLRRVLEYIGLSWNGRCLDYFATGGATATQSAAQVREAPHRRSIGRWRRFETELGPMRAVLDEAGLL